MSILKSIVNVNNGNTGWTASNVIDALETVFSNLGFHGGSAVTGVPCGLINPNNLVSTDNNDWRQAGGSPVYSNHKTYYYDVEAQGTTAYRWMRKSNIFQWNYVYSENDSNRPNEIRIEGQGSGYGHGLVQNQAIHWAPGETDENKNISGLTLDTVYYVIVVDSDHIKLATDATNAANGTNITLTYGGYSSSNYAVKSSSPSYFRQESLSTYDNLTLAIDTGDILNINLISTGAGNFHFCYDTDSYDASNYVVEGLSGNDSVDANPTGTGSDSGNVVWDTWGYVQTYTAVTPQPTFHPTETYQEPGRKYIYANDTNSSMKGTIIINPKVNSRSGGPDPFWDYEVPQSGDRSALKIRVWRHQPSSTSYKGKIRGMKILNQGSGWTAGEAFTIPGDQIGGATPANDITFGTRVNGDVDLGDGTPEIAVTKLGGGSSFFQKADNGQWAVLKNINDASKTYGTSYYAFGVDTSTNNRLNINSGSGWNWFNRPGTRETSGTTNGGFFTGYQGLDRQSNFNHAITTDSTYYYFDHINYCTSATPTAYPLQIRVYRAQSPQDTNFAIIQFCQIIDTEVQTFGTFTIYRGSAFGTNIWDLDYVYNGSMMTYETSTREIILRHRVVGWYYQYYGSYGEPNEEPPSNYSTARESFWGYLRDPNDIRYIDSSYKCNIETTTDNNDLILYYRNGTYDQYNGNGVDSGANYYRPIKGLPLNERLVPCPYYLPDDFVMLQVSTSPGLTQFRTGDTVTIGGNENYEIIRASYQTQQNGLDGINNNSTMGMLFLGRIN